MIAIVRRVSLLWPFQEQCTLQPCYDLSYGLSSACLVVNTIRHCLCVKLFYLDSIIRRVFFVMCVYCALESWFALSYSSDFLARSFAYLPFRRFALFLIAIRYDLQCPMVVNSSAKFVVVASDFRFQIFLRPPTNNSGNLEV